MDCAEVVKSRPDLLSVSGLTASEMSLAICLASDYIADPDRISAVTRSRQSLWPNLSKAVSGGLTHIISADNPAGYAELWRSGDGNWYASTGADPDKGLMTKSELVERGRRGGLYEIRGIYKGDTAERAVKLFLGRVFPLTLLKSAGCGCPAAQRMQETLG